ncbi:G-protein-signaling modulator 2-like [Pocillopora verrucosa]|uniref:G-protein-signaling modulator 2-like n=1 Tax=Pocillopora verrucosa TaxID=203993 RepID=UPI0033420234
MKIRDKKGEADARTNLGEVLRSLGEYQKAKEYLRKHLPSTWKLETRGGEADARTNLGEVLRSLGEYQKAEEYSEKALAIFMEIRDKKGEADAHTNLGAMFIHSVNIRRLKNILRKYLPSTWKLEKEGRSRRSHKPREVLNRLGEYQKAKEYFEKALAIYMQIKNKEGEAGARGKLGAVLHSLGEYQKAKEYNEKALAIFMDIRDKRGRSRRSHKPRRGVTFTWRISEG